MNISIQEKSIMFGEDCNFAVLIRRVCEKINKNGISIKDAISDTWYQLEDEKLSAFIKKDRQGVERFVINGHGAEIEFNEINGLLTLTCTFMMNARRQSVLFINTATCQLEKAVLTTDYTEGMPDDSVGREMIIADQHIITFDIVNEHISLSSSSAPELSNIKLALWDQTANPLHECIMIDSIGSSYSVATYFDNFRAANKALSV